MELGFRLRRKFGQLAKVSSTAVAGIVWTGALAAHADRDAVVGQQDSEGRAGELAAPVGAAQDN